MPLVKLIARAAIAGIVFMGACGATAAGGFIFLAKAADYEPLYLLDKVAEGLFAKTTVSQLDDRLTKVENVVIQGGSAPRGQSISAPARAQPADFTAPTRLASAGERPPLERAPEPAFSAAAEVDEVDFSQEIPAPVFAGLDKPGIDVCQTADCRYTTLSAAYKNAEDGDVITVGPGIYGDCIKAIKKNIAIVGRPAADGSRPTFDRPCAGKAAFNVQSDYFRLEGVQVQGIKVRDKNGACARVYHKVKQVVHLKNVICLDSENGILGSPGPEGAVIVEDSLFVNNGLRGKAHGIYLNGGHEAVLRNTVVHSTKGSGHSLKIGSDRLLILSSIVAALDGKNSRAVDFYGGGVLYVEDSVVQQGKNSENHELFALAMEPKRLNLDVPHAVYLRNNWLIYDDLGRCCRWIFQGRKTGQILMENNRLVGFTGSRIEEFEERNNRYFDDRRRADLAQYDGTLASLPLPSAWQ